MKQQQQIVRTKKTGTHKRVRCRLDSLIDCRRESARLYRAGLSGAMTVDNVRQLAHVLRIVGSFIVDGELELRLAALEAANER